MNGNHKSPGWMRVAESAFIALALVAAGIYWTVSLAIGGHSIAALVVGFFTMIIAAFGFQVTLLEIRGIYRRRAQIELYRSELRDMKICGNEHSNVDEKLIDQWIILSTAPFANGGHSEPETTARRLIQKLAVFGELERADGRLIQNKAPSTIYLDWILKLVRAHEIAEIVRKSSYSDFSVLDEVTQILLDLTYEEIDEESVPEIAAEVEQINHLAMLKLTEGARRDVLSEAALAIQRKREEAAMRQRTRTMAEHRYDRRFNVGDS